MSEVKRKAHATFPDLVGKEALLTDTMTSFLVGQEAEISGSIESGEFKITSLIRGVEFTKRTNYIEKGASRVDISDVKILVDNVNGRPLDLSCVDVMTIIEKGISDDEKIVSHTFNVKVDEHGVMLYRVDDHLDNHLDDLPEIEFTLSGDGL